MMQKIKVSGEWSRTYLVRDTKQAINKITSKERKTIVIFCSFYLIGDVLRNNQEF